MITKTKRALVTGANKSIGFETVRLLALAGYHVFMGCRDIVKGEAAAAQLRASGLHAVTVIELDISRPASVAQAKEQVEALTDHLDALVNNAGISGILPQPASVTDVALIRRVFDTNFFGTIQTTQAFIPLLRRSPAPRIVNVSSGLGSLTQHSDPNWEYYAIKSAAYGPSKTALNAYTVALAYELKDTAFKVNSIDPGYTATDFNNHRGPGTIAEATVAIIQFATAADGPTGKFYDAKGELPW
jgi:NAD(P)-dependent dehydrogenase (short-subunit alcohol dehydrogenase family)